MDQLCVLRRLEAGGGRMEARSNFGFLHGIGGGHFDAHVNAGIGEARMF